MILPPHKAAASRPRGGCARHILEALKDFGFETSPKSGPAESEAKYGNTKIFFIGRPELMRNKRASGRPQDLADLSWLEKA